MIYTDGLRPYLVESRQDNGPVRALFAHKLRGQSLSVIGLTTLTRSAGQIKKVDTTLTTSVYQPLLIDGAADGWNETRASKGQHIMVNDRYAIIAPRDINCDIPLLEYMMVNNLLTGLVNVR
ncbi:hypothetical protein [Actinomyces vulturis]|uniref:hypothetical protein n=1 Tax=Actinomyces vulturis TaxID=1857645 RepID=UPI00082BD316|nr:hypothetical protein [Actinomyces vulturis]